MQNCVHSWPSHYMELRDQLQAVSSLPPEIWLGISLGISWSVSSSCLYEKLTVVEIIAELIPWFLCVRLILPFILMLMLQCITFYVGTNPLQIIMIEHAICKQSPVWDRYKLQKRDLHFTRQTNSVYVTNCMYSGSAHKGNRGRENMTPDMTGSSQ